MRMTVVSVFDVAAGVFGRPVFCGSKGLAIRSFQDECRRVAPENEMSKHPEDFMLFLLGEFDDNDGQFFPADSGKPFLLFKGSDSK